MLRVLRSPVLAVCALALVWAGCDDTPGVTDPFGSPPAITSFALTPDSVYASGGDFVEIPLSVQVGVANGEGEVTVRVFVRDLDGSTLLAEGSASGSGSIDQQVPFQLPRGAVGRYQVTVTTEDASGRLGDRASGVFVLASESLGAPTISATTATPGTITRPSSGQAVVTVTVDAADVDGRANLARVELREPASVGGALLFRFSDDGSGGDERADDGRYTLRLGLGANSELGTYLFDAVAIDRSGLESTPAEISFVLQ